MEKAYAWYVLLDRVHCINSNFHDFVASEFEPCEDEPDIIMTDVEVKAKVDAIATALGDLYQLIGTRWNEVEENQSASTTSPST